MSAVDVAPVRRSLAAGVGVWLGWFAAGWLAGVVGWVMLPAVLLGWSPTVVTSGSMEPRIRAGDIVHLAPPADIEVGAVIRFPDELGRHVLHRVVHVHPDGSLQTRGDANARPDTMPVDIGQVTGRGVLLIPYAAHPLSIAGAVFVTVAFAVRLAQHRRRPVAAAGLLLLAVAVAAVGLPGAARAAFTDTTTTTGSQFTALTVAAPTSLSAQCGLIGVGSGQVHLSWPASPTPGVTGYQILHAVGGATPTVIGTVTAPTTSHTHTFNPALLGLGTYNYTTRATHGSFTSPPSPGSSVAIVQLLGATICL